VRYLAEEGSRAARILQRLQRDPNRFLSTVLLINTVALIVASSATTLLTDDLFHAWGVPHEYVLWLALLVSLLLSVLLLLLAEVHGLGGCGEERHTAGNCANLQAAPPHSPAGLQGRPRSHRRTYSCQGPAALLHTVERA